MSTSNVRPADMERITTPALAQKYIDEQIKELRAQIGDKKVLLALSGGVDSSVVAALLIKAVGKQLVSVHVNHGLLRKGEPEQVIKVFRDELNRIDLKPLDVEGKTFSGAYLMNHGLEMPYRNEPEWSKKNDWSSRVLLLEAE